MIKLLIGGSPCTHWSIAQCKNRETKAEGIGWELFLNYVIAKEKFQPNYFLYENNWSTSKEIKGQIQEELNCELMRINSRLVSAQNRDRFYVFNWNVEQPEDKGILLRDILETGEPWVDKSYALTTRYNGAIPEDTLKRHRRTMITEPVRVGDLPNAKGEISDSQATRIYSINGKSVTLVANGGGQGAKTGLYAIPCAGRVVGRKINSKGRRDDYNTNTPIVQRFEVNQNPDKTNCLTSVSKDNMIAVPVCLRYERAEEAKRLRKAYEHGEIHHKYHEFHELHPRTDSKTNTLTTVQKDNQIIEPISKYCGTVSKPIYEVCNGMITINGKTYPIKLRDGYYIIRKLTPIECEKLQTMPDGYTSVVSNTQRYKCLGNGWTVEVIIHILNGILKDVPKDEKILVLSMYDGIGTGRYCLDKMGFTNVEYHAFEIDKYAVKVAMSNYPDIIQHGDAFQVRNDDFKI